MIVDYEVVKKKARLAMGGKMNIIERSAFWFRYERNSHREGYPEEKPIIYQEAELAPMRIYLNIDRKSMELQKRIALLESQINPLKEKKTYVNNKTKIYKYK